MQKFVFVSVCLISLISCVFGLHPSLLSTSSSMNRASNENRLEANVEQVPYRPTTQSTTTTTTRPSTSTPVAASPSPAQFGTCWVGQINKCTGESAAWSDKTPIARATVAIVTASLSALSNLPGRVGFGLVEANSESSIQTESETETETETTSRCSGRCQAPNSACGTRYQTGLCPGSSVCCIAATTSSTPAPSSTTSTALTGVSSRTLDPMKDIITPRRTVTWAMLTSEQQTNARLLVRYAKQQQITNINALAYIMGTAHWECHIKPIREWSGAKKRYAPYYGRGFVQLTWRENYNKFTALLKSQIGVTANLVASPDLALNPTNAAFIAAYGMKHGTFTTRRLDQYFTATKSDFAGARAIINGRDKAETIATLSRLWVSLARTLYSQA